MKKFVLICCLLGFIFGAALSPSWFAQGISKVTNEQQVEFQAALKDFQAKQQAFKLAQSESEASFAKMQQVIFKTMAKLQLDPDKYEASLNQDGTLSFVEKKVDKK